MPRVHVWFRTLLPLILVPLLPRISSSYSQEFSISLQDTRWPTPTTVTSEYYGQADTVYAFLMSGRTERRPLAAVVVGWQLEPDSAVTNLGFTPLDGWSWADTTTPGFQVPWNAGVQDGTNVLGYWTFALAGRPQATLRLQNSIGPDGAVAVLVDDAGCEYVATTLNHGSVNGEVPAPTTNASSDEFFLDPPHHVLFRSAPRAISLPAGTIGVPIANLAAVDSALVRVMTSHEPLRIDRAFPRTSEADSVLDADGVAVRLPPLWDVYQLTLADSSDVAAVMDSLTATNRVVYAERDEIPRFDARPTDEYYRDGHQWGLWNYGQAHPNYPSQGDPIPGCDIGAKDAWDLYRGNPDGLLAIVDRGICPHPDLDDRTVIPDDSCSQAGDPFHAYHGTAVAGVAAATTNDPDGAGMAGVDWQCRLYNSYVEDNAGIHIFADSILGAQAAGAQVINMSWGVDVSVVRCFCPPNPVLLGRYHEAIGGRCG